MREIDLPDGRVGEFPDSMSDHAIAAVLRRQFPPTPYDRNLYPTGYPTESQVKQAGQDAWNLVKMVGGGAATAGAGSLASGAVAGASPLLRALVPALARIGATGGVEGAAAGAQGENPLPAAAKGAGWSGAAEAVVPGVTNALQAIGPLARRMDVNRLGQAIGRSLPEFATKNARGLYDLVRGGEGAQTRQEMLGNAFTKMDEMLAKPKPPTPSSAPKALPPAQTTVVGPPSNYAGPERSVSGPSDVRLPSHYDVSRGPVRVPEEGLWNRMGIEDISGSLPPALLRQPFQIGGKPTTLREAVARLSELRERAYPESLAGLPFAERQAVRQAQQEYAALRKEIPQAMERVNPGTGSLFDVSYDRAGAHAAWLTIMNKALGANGQYDAKKAMEMVNANPGKWQAAFGSHWPTATLAILRGQQPGPGVVDLGGATRPWELARNLLQRRMKGPEAPFVAPNAVRAGADVAAQNPYVQLGALEAASSVKAPYRWMERTGE